MNFNMASGMMQNMNPGMNMMPGMPNPGAGMMPGPGPFEQTNNFGMPFPGSSNFMTNTTSTLENKITRIENHLKRLEKRMTTLEHELHGNTLNSENYQYSSLQMM